MLLESFLTDHASTIRFSEELEADGEVLLRIAWEHTIESINITATRPIRKDNRRRGLLRDRPPVHTFL